VAGLIGLVLAIAWFLGPSRETVPQSQVVAGIPLPVAAPSEAPVRPKQDPAAGIGVRPGLGLEVPATSAGAFEAVPPAAVVEPLGDAPIPELLEAIHGQMLPRIGADGRRAWQVYARPVDRKDDRPRVALIIGGLGLSQAATEASIERLPGAVTLAFDTYADETANWTRRARRNGHETLATLSLQVADFPFRDLGPQTLGAVATPAANLKRLDGVLAAAPGAVGVLAIGGSEFNRTTEAAVPILKSIKARGLMFVDATPLSGPSLVELAAKLDVPRLHVNVMLDTVPEAAAIDQALERLVAIARERLVSVGLGRPMPVTFARIQAWASRLDADGIALVPASAVVGTQFGSP
jgi:Uncharacterized protein conserved in bacteria